MDSPDEQAAAKFWKEFHAAIEEMKLDDWGAHWKNIDYMYDAALAGFYAGRDYERGKYTESEVDNAALRSHRARSAASKVLRAPNSSKAAKTKCGSALTQRN